MTDLKSLFRDLAAPGVRELMPYRPGKPIEELQREMGLATVIKLASNENPLGPSPLALNLIRGKLQDVSRYPDGGGFELKRALAEKLTVSASMVTLGNGSNDVLELLARAFLTENDQVVYSKYAFAVYPIVAKAVNATAYVSKDRAFGHDLEAMRIAITNRTRMVFIANPNNPTGTYLKADELRGFLKDLPDHVIVVLDEAYYEYASDPRTGAVGYPTDSIQWINDYPNLVITRTFSKAYGLAGLRVGYSVSHPVVADLLNRVRQPFNCNNLALAAAVAALSDKQHLERSIHLNAQGLTQLCKGFKDLGLRYIPSVGNFVSVEVGGNANSVYAALLEQGVIVRPVSTYEMPQFLRISVGTQAENQTFLQALRMILSKMKYA